VKTCYNTTIIASTPSSDIEYNNWGSDLGSTGSVDILTGALEGGFTGFAIRVCLWLISACRPQLQRWVPVHKQKPSQNLTQEGCPAWSIPPVFKGFYIKHSKCKEYYRGNNVSLKGGEEGQNLVQTAKVKDYMNVARLLVNKRAH